MMLPNNENTLATTQATRQRGHWFKPIQCSICTQFIWLSFIALAEPVEAPEPRQQWVLCKTCHEALLIELGRSTIRSSVRLRVAMGLVAAERSPEAYPPQIPSAEREPFQREFVWFIWLVVLFGLLHLVIFGIVVFAR